MLQGAARILAAEAEHAGNIRLVTNQLGLTLSPIDGVDVVPPANGNGSNSFAVDTNASSATAGLAIIRTPLQVLNIVLAGNTSTLRGGFFPNGLYANTNTLLNLT